MRNTAPRSGRPMVKAMAIFFCMSTRPEKSRSRLPNRATADGGCTESGLPSASTSAGNSPNASIALARLPVFFMVLIVCSCSAGGRTLRLRRPALQRALGFSALLFEQPCHLLQTQRVTAVQDVITALVALLFEVVLVLRVCVIVGATQVNT